MTMRTSLPLLVLALAAPAGAQQFPTADPVIKRIWDEGMTGKSQIANLAQVLMDSIGPRLTSSPGHQNAVQWLQNMYKSWGVPVRAEKYGTWRSWKRHALPPALRPDRRLPRAPRTAARGPPRPRAGRAAAGRSARPGEDAAFLVCILTDGEERDSTKYTGKALGSRVRRLQDTGKWTFTLMGPQRNLAQISDLLGIDASNVAGFEPESLSSRTQVIHTESLKMDNYMTMRSLNVACAQNLYAPQDE